MKNLLSFKLFILDVFFEKYLCFAFIKKGKK